MRVIFGCESARKGSYQAIRTFPLGYASYSQTEVNTLLFRQKSSYSIRSGPKVIHNEHCFQSATDFLIYMQIAILFSLHTGRTHEYYAMGTIPLWNEINAVCQIMVNTAKGEDSTDEWLALITSAISALPGLSLFGVVMDIGNVSFHFAFVAEDIFHLNDIYKEVYNYYN